MEREADARWHRSRETVLPASAVAPHLDSESRINAITRQRRSENAQWPSGRTAQRLLDLLLQLFRDHVYVG